MRFAVRPNEKGVFAGEIIDGAFGKFLSEVAVVGLCNVCGEVRLSEDLRHNDDVYSSSKYREVLAAGETANDYLFAHDILQLFNLEVLWSEIIRNKIIFDSVCAPGHAQKTIHL